VAPPFIVDQGKELWKFYVKAITRVLTLRPEFKNSNCKSGAKVV